MAEEQQKRQVARKLWIHDLLTGAYVKEEGFKPNYVVFPDNTRAARVNLLGVVVTTSTEGLQTITLDDGSGRISIRAFEPQTQLKNLQVGDVVNIIGRPRQFGNEIYVLPEIVRKINDLLWLELRKLELSRTQINNAQQDSTIAPEVAEDVIDDSFNLAENVLNAIRSLDQGQGADTEAVIEQIGVRDAEKTIQFLLQNGDIFELSKGKLKVLE